MKPAPVRVWHTVPMTVCDTLFKALARPVPSAPSRPLRRSLHRQSAWLRRRDRAIFLSHIGHPGGGWGAKSDEDGMNATVCAQRRRHPQLAGGSDRSQESRSSSSSAPCARTPAAPASIAAAWASRSRPTCASRRRSTRAWSGRFARPGGCTAARKSLANRVSIVRDDGTVKRFPTGKFNPTELAEGDGFSGRDRRRRRILESARARAGEGAGRCALRLCIAGSGPARLWRGDSPAGAAL